MGVMQKLRDLSRPARRAITTSLRSRKAAHDVRPYLRPRDPDAAVAAATNDMERIFYSHRGRPTSKWHHYLEAYDRHLSRFRGTDVHILEIGVNKGGSLQLWRKYFGAAAVIYGIDINEACRAFDSPDAGVRIGSQSDAAFLKGVAAEMGRLDIVIDDGGHVAEEQRASFATLFPLLSPQGVYFCEDLQTSYWEVFHNGGYRRRGTFIEHVKQLIDDMHAWYHDQPQRALRDAASSIHCISMYEGLAVIEKRPKQRGTFCGMPPGA